MTTINLRPRLYVGASALYVSVVASVPEVAWAFAYDYGFLRIRLPNLVAKIVGPKTVSKRDDFFNLDGGWSYDPESKWLYYRNLNFTWNCQRICPRNAMNGLPLSRPKEEPCYGISNDTKFVFSNQRIATVEIAWMRSNCTYTFRMSVAKDSRISNTDHKVQVLPVPLSIR